MDRASDRIDEILRNAGRLVRSDPSFLPSAGLMESSLNPRLAYGTMQKLIARRKG
jgi:hypothetical protein